MTPTHEIFLGQQKLSDKKTQIKEQFIKTESDLFYEIENYKNMSPFFMTITSNSNHWMFISSTGGLTAGRVNSESAIFPYYTDDKITENYGNTGPATILLITRADKTYLWEPFANGNERIYKILSRLSKNVNGNVVVFEEVNETLGISFSYRWMNSKQYGWIRKASLKNLNEGDVTIEIVDGMKNILPAGTSSHIQNAFGNLLNAYKSSEVDRESGLGIFALSATLTDLAEPSESLKANTLWQCGLDVKNYLLSDKQLENFSRGKEIKGEWENKGDRGCYFVHAAFPLSAQQNREWYFAIDVDRDHSQINDLKKVLLENKADMENNLNDDIRSGQNSLEEILLQNDGVQNTSSLMNSVHHKSNVLFNIMRGGYFYNSYNISISDLSDFISSVSRATGAKFKEKLNQLGKNVNYDEVLAFILSQNDADLERIWYEYLPLTFSRRHGDPSRPWNLFSIETEKGDGTAKLDYQGNWRDIFQNWEALCYSYPLYLKHIIGKFLNATTKDGYNPYRITKDGIDWEVPEPGNPWANIGYWNDHQIIYLLKLLEMYKNFNGEKMLQEMDQPVYSFANVPYEIKSFSEIVKDPFQTIVFNDDKHEKIEKLTEEIGNDGKMILNSDGTVFLATMTEKLFILLLSKLSNYIPEGGIWMNTQRPEWNDANNALVGKGISVVTLAYVRRYISFLKDIIADASQSSFSFHSDTAEWFKSISSVFSAYGKELNHIQSPREKYSTVESLGVASENYRNKFYREDPDTSSTDIPVKELLSFLETSLTCVDDTLRKNRRDDNLYHSYNTLQMDNRDLIIHNLYEMLEGQVAILSSGLLSAREADETLKALEKSSIYREDQNSYMLYPNRTLSGFLEKNNIDEQRILSSELLKKLIHDGNKELISKDDFGKYHFHGSFNNVKQVREVLQELSAIEVYSQLVSEEGGEIQTLFEETFNHQSFTGRSGTFFSYEGLGSIYWHMVSKLLLAVQENVFNAAERGEDTKIINSIKDHYYKIRRGIGYNKSAHEYGAFPFDPYSHTPLGKGAKQPGMTGQVKEEVITRLAETGITIAEGKICFDSLLLDESEFHKKSVMWNIQTVAGEELNLPIPAESFGVTFCQTPFILRKNREPSITVIYGDKRKQQIDGSVLPEEISSDIFNRKGNISYLEINI